MGIWGWDWSDDECGVDSEMGLDSNLTRWKAYCCVGVEEELLIRSQYV